ncbi:hypothetical protein ABPG74_018732 [Tetrahymena malaccensis]
MNQVQQQQDLNGLSDINLDNIYQQLIKYYESKEQLQKTEILNLHILICNLSMTDIQDILDQIYSYKLIKNLKLSLRFYRSEKYQSQFIQILAKLIFKMCQIEHFIINKEAQTITIENIIPFLKEAQNHIELNQLTVNFNYLSEKFESEIHYNLMLFSQELGYLSQIKKLNFQIQNFELNQQYAIGIFQGFRDYQHIEKLHLKFLIEDVDIQVFEYIKEQISKLNNLKELKIRISIAEENIQSIQQVILETMVSLKLLEVLSINILIKQAKNTNTNKQLQLPENLIVQNSIKNLTVKIKNEQQKENDISFSKFDNQIFFGCNNLQQLSWDLTNCNDKNIEHFCSLLSNNKQLNSLKLKIGKNKLFNNLCLSVQNIQLLEKINIQIDQDYIKQLEDVREVSQLFKQCKQLKQLKINLLNCFLKSEILNALSLEISSCQQLQILVFKFGINVTQKIDSVQFFKNLQKNQNLNYLFFDFNIHKKKVCHKIQVGQQNQPRYCGTYYLNMSMKNLSIKQLLNDFKQIVNLKSKKFKRLVKYECICDRLYYWNEDQNQQYNYRFLSLYGGGDDDYF